MIYFWQEYYKLLDSADEKVQLANQVYDTVSLSLSMVQAKIKFLF